MQKKDFQNWSKEKLLHEYKGLLKRKKFGIVWEDKIEEVAEQCKTFLPVLKDEKTKSFSTDKNGINHIFIEGDNYHALSVLNYTHKRKIDVIYIDPPYNTGAKDWKYNNHFVDINDRYRHSKWLSMIEKRLRLAKNLLKSDGVLIVTIDDNELNALSLLLDEIFPGKVRNTVVIVNNPHGVARSGFSRCHEYAIFMLNPGQTINKKPVPEDVRSINLRRSGNNSLRKDSPTMFYPILVDKKTLKVIGVGEVPAIDFHPEKQTIERKSFYELWPLDSQGVEKNWYYSRTRVVEKGQDEIEIKKVKSEIQPYFHHSNNSEQTYKSVWTGSEYDAGAYGSSLVKRILNHEFPFPKSLHAVKDCIKAVIHDKNNAIILDFFAGSGTTGHAVLELNKEDGGNRQFILCTNNEDNNGSGFNIASDICYPRIKNVIKGYTTKEEKVKGLGGSLKYFSTEFVNNIRTDNDKRVFTSRSTEMLCLAETTFDEVANKKGLFAIYENQKQMTGIVFDEDAITDFKKEAKKYKKPIVVYVFSYDHTYNEEDFEDLANLKVVKPIPEVILNVYRKIYKELYKPRNL